MQLTTKQAASLTGRNRTTIYRACKKGRLSAIKDDAGNYLIETAELERVFGLLHPMHAEPEAQPMHSPASAGASTLLQLELRHTRDQLAQERVHREEQKHQYERELAFLRDLIQTRDDHIRALTHQPETKRAGWWSRLIGRG